MNLWLEISYNENCFPNWNQQNLNKVKKEKTFETNTKPLKQIMGLHGIKLVKIIHS